MAEDVEEVLAGGMVNEVVRVGATVRRRAGPHTPFVQALLGMLAAQGWSGAPRPLGIDDQGREVLGYVDGFVPWEPADRAGVDADAALVGVAELTRRLHDLTAGSDLAAGAEVVCHNDLAPRNTVYERRGDGLVPVAFVDWDLAGPGERIHDVAHVCWQFVGLGPERTDVGTAAGKVRLLCDAYGLEPAGRARLVDTILWWQDRCWRGIEAGATAGDPAMTRLRQRGAVRDVQASYAWTRNHRAAIERRLT